jgi:HD superfamily phosphodiesterase
MYNEAKEHLLLILENADKKWSYMYSHVPQVEKWALKIAKKGPEVNLEILLTAVWLHDIGQLIGKKEVDHAIKSEDEVRRFLKSKSVPEDTIGKVAHCVRAHRCSDVKPVSLEAAILAVADSVSHMTDSVYIDFAMRGNLNLAKEKLERDFRDAGLVPEVKTEIKPLYESWKRLLNVYPN